MEFVVHLLKKYNVQADIIVESAPSTEAFKAIKNKIRKTMDDDFIPIFPESIDIKITNYCENNCPMCHESSNINGTHANLNHPFLTVISIFHTIYPTVQDIQQCFFLNR